jgi:hypothetical protein
LRRSEEAVYALAVAPGLMLLARAVLVGAAAHLTHLPVRCA